MRAGPLLAFLARTIPARIPVLLVGSPGCGKSDLVAQATAAAGADLLISHPAVSDPTDAKGLPWAGPDQTEARFLPFGDMARAMRATRPLVWFLDDLGQATPAVQASYMQLLLARRVADHVLPDCVTFLSATNRRTDRAAVSGILEPVKSRFGAIVTVEPHLDDWCAWAVTHDIPAPIVAFLRFRPELLSKFEPTGDLTNSPLPRTWAHAARIFGLGLPDALQREAIAGAVGEGAAIEFTAFLRVYAELPDLDAIIANPTKWGIVPKDPAMLYAVVTGLATKGTAETRAAIFVYAAALVAKGKGEFAALLARDLVRRDATTMADPAYLAALRGPLGALISGA